VLPGAVAERGEARLHEALELDQARGRLTGQVDHLGAERPHLGEGDGHRRRRGHERRHLGDGVLDAQAIPDREAQVRVGAGLGHESDARLGHPSPEGTDGAGALPIQGQLHGERHRRPS